MSQSCDPLTRFGSKGVADGDEEDPGAYIAYNNDDDNENGVPDYQETAENTSEDDLVEITLIDCLPDSNDLTGFLQLKVECGVAGNIKVWSSEHKGAGNLVIEGAGDEHWAIGSVPGSLWVEGSGTGTGQLSLGYSPDEISFSGADIVNVTIVQVHMNMDGVAESEEESVGGYIALGSDNTVLDLYVVSPPWNPVPEPPTGVPFDSGHPMILDVNYASRGSGLIEFWDYSNPAEPNQLSLPKRYYSAEKLPTDLRIKGTKASSAHRLITLIWEYSIQGRTVEDRIKLTVYGVEDVQWETYPDTVVEDPDPDHGANLLKLTD